MILNYEVTKLIFVPLEGPQPHLFSNLSPLPEWTDSRGCDSGETASHLLQPEPQGLQDPDRCRRGQSPVFQAASRKPWDCTFQQSLSKRSLPQVLLSRQFY